jgi:CBS domain-containing protein
MRVRDIMTPTPACCTRDTSLTDVARIMADRDCGAVPVIDNQKEAHPVGIVTDRDIVLRTLANGQDPFQMAAGDCMSPAPVTVSADEDVSACTEQMKQHQLRRILVTDDDGRCCGIVAQADVAWQLGQREAGEVVLQVSQ